MADILSMLQHLGGPQGPPPGPPTQGPPQGGPSGSERAPIQILKQMIDLANQYMQVEPDAEDKATMAKLLQTLHQYLAKDQQDTAQAIGSPAVQRVLRKS